MPDLAEQDGKIIKTILTIVSSVDEEDGGKYRAHCGYYFNSLRERFPILVLVPEEGKKFFEVFAPQGAKAFGPQYIYLQVHSKNPIQIGEKTYALEALGTIYNEASNTYAWSLPVKNEILPGSRSSRTSVNSASDAPSGSAPLPPPEKKELKFNEVKAQIIALDGKVVKTTINRVSNFEQLAQGKYLAYCGCSGAINSSAVMYIPEEGKEFFQTLENHYQYNGTGKTIYVRVRGKALDAVGTRYSNSRGEYSW
jgi:hypothetical protein